VLLIFWITFALFILLDFTAVSYSVTCKCSCLLTSILSVWLPNKQQFCSGWIWRSAVRLNCFWNIYKPMKLQRLPFNDLKILKLCKVNRNRNSGIETRRKGKYTRRKQNIVNFIIMWKAHFGSGSNKHGKLTNRDLDMAVPWLYW
jgi:hypothetical protein